MKLPSSSNRGMEKYPFRSVAITSFITGSLSIILGVILLLKTKPALKASLEIVAIERLLAGLTLLVLGCRSLWRGYQREYEFNLDEVYDPAHNASVNSLLHHRRAEGRVVANDLSNALHNKSFSITDGEKAIVSDWQLLFYKLLSQKGINNLFNYLPYPITNFIANQSRPIVLLGGFAGILITFLFISYLEVLPFPLSMTWINLALLLGLLSFWKPEKIDHLLHRRNPREPRKNLFFMIAVFIAAYLLYKPFADYINLGILLSFLLIAGIMVLTAVLSFKLIESVFTRREVVNVQTTALDLATHRASTQPNNILQQFKNAVQSITGWNEQLSTGDARDKLAGDQLRKGDFEYEYLFETRPYICSTSYDEQSERWLSLAWKSGTALICIGLLLFFTGILITPGINLDTFRNGSDQAIQRYSGDMLYSVYFILTGTAFYFFGRKLVYEIYLFFNMEVFFCSDLLLFKADGNYDEYEHKSNDIKRKDTFTDFTPDIQACRVISSIFLHPYKDRSQISRAPRFIVRIDSNEDLHKSVVGAFYENMESYMAKFPFTNSSTSKVFNSGPDRISNTD